MLRMIAESLAGPFWRSERHRLEHTIGVRWSRLNADFQDPTGHLRGVQGNEIMPKIRGDAPPGLHRPYHFAESCSGGRSQDIRST